MTNFVLADEEYKLDMLNTPYAKKKFHYDVEKMLYSSENIFGIVSWKKHNGIWSTNNSW